MTAALALVSAVPDNPAAGAQPINIAAAGDYWIMGGDQGGRRLIAFDPAVTDWNSSAAVKWTWRATTARGFSSAESAATGLIADFKLRNTPYGRRFVISDGRGLAAIVTYPRGNRVWAKVISGNLHSAELLPNGNIAVAASTGGFVRVYASSQGPNADTYAEFRLAGAHATQWDPLTSRLWVTGRDRATGEHILTALVVSGTAAEPRLFEDRSWRVRLPSPGGHDVSGYYYDPGKLWVTTNGGAYLFDKATKTFSELGGASRSSVKSIGNQPSGQIVQTRPDAVKNPPGGCTDNYWCTDTVDFFSPDTLTLDMTRTRRGASFYKARVWSPYYTVPSEHVVPHGTLWHRARSATGTWDPHADGIDDNRRLTAIAAASLPNGELPVFTLVPGSGAWLRSRSASGVWDAHATMIDDNGAISAIATAGAPDGSLHFFAVVPGSGIWWKPRRPDGTWAAHASKIDSNGTVTAIAAAALPDGSLSVFGLVPGSGIWERRRSVGGVWGSATKIDSNGAVTAIAAASLPDGSVSLFSAMPTKGIWERTRSASGRWATNATMIDTNEATTALAAAGLSDGRISLASVRLGGGVWERTRSAAGVWTDPAVGIDGNGDVFTVTAAALRDGTVHVLTIPDLS